MSKFTDAQLRKKYLELERKLRQTTEGFDPRGVYWRSAMDMLDELQADVAVPASKVPALGPVYPGGKSILKEDCTHYTSGLDWPAFDTAFPSGKIRLRNIIAPEPVVVYDDTSDAQGGDAFYVRGDSGIRYWVAHISHVPKQGTRFKKGQVMTRVSADHPRIHCHLALDVRKLTGGRHLISHRNYTHGAPLIGVQLARMMEV